MTQVLVDNHQLEITISGFGGQGVILMGQVLGKAALHDGRHAILAQNYGPEARGSACRADLIIASAPIDYPRVKSPRVLIALSQDGYTQNRHSLVGDGLLLYEQDLVKLDEADGPAASQATAPLNGHGRKNGLARTRLEAIPATRLAEELGGRIMTNMVMLGFCIGRTGIVSPEAVERAIRESVPRGTEARNLASFGRGMDYARTLAS